MLIRMPNSDFPVVVIRCVLEITRTLGVNIMSSTRAGTKVIPCVQNGFTACTCEHFMMDSQMLLNLVSHVLGRKAGVYQYTLGYQ